MSTRKTTTERIELQKEKMEQMQNEMNRLKRQHNAEERKKRNHRICKRGAHIESLLPDTIVLSDERFFAFLEKTITNDFGRKTLATLKAEQDKDDAKNGTVGTESNGDTRAEPSAVVTAQGGKAPTLRTAAPPYNNDEHEAAKPAQTKDAPDVADGGKTENVARSGA